MRCRKRPRQDCERDVTSPEDGRMDGLKERLRNLMAMREGMEKEIAERLGRLEGPGGAGRTGSLVDAEGFPRADIDVHAVREDRHRVIVLTNDHKAITDEIQQALQELHERARSEQDTASQDRMEESSSSPTDGSCFPFAYVDGVSPDSPATDAGIECGDQLCRFGSIAGRASQNEGILSRLAASLKVHEGREVETVFLRNGEVRRMKLTPRKWGGPGLIGCHLRPLP